VARVHVQRPQQISTRRVLAYQPRCRQFGMVVGIEVIGLLLEDSGESRCLLGPPREKVDPAEPVTGTHRPGTQRQCSGEGGACSAGSSFP